jgi:sialic acid synthase SpsE
MSDLDEVRKAVNEIIPYQNKVSQKMFPALTILHCTSSYPCDFNEANLRSIPFLSKKTGLPVGYSDHTLGIEASIAAAALGATVIEKHFTLYKDMDGPDHNSSLEPDEFKELVGCLRNITEALGRAEKKPTPAEKSILKQTRRSLVLNRDVRRGDLIDKEMISIKRPGWGIPPSDIEKVSGLKICRSKFKDEVLTWEDFE